LGNDYDLAVPAPSSDRYVGGAYLGANPEWHEDRAAWKAGHVASILTRNGITPHSVLDIGCGTGGVLEHLTGSFTLDRAVGIDVSEDAIALAGESRHEQVSLQVGDVRDMDDRFDVVLALDVIEHVEDYFGLLRAVQRLGMHFVFHVPLALNVPAIVRMSPITRSREQVGHIHYFGAETARSSLDETGYRVLDEMYTVAGLQARQGDPLRRRLARVPRRAAFRVRPHLACRWLGGSSVLFLATPQD
jgi:SAM-dependent methyltransferase